MSRRVPLARVAGAGEARPPAAVRGHGGAATITDRGLWRAPDVRVMDDLRRSRVGPWLFFTGGVGTSSPFAPRRATSVLPRFRLHRGTSSRSGQTTVSRGQCRPPFPPEGEQRAVVDVGGPTSGVAPPAAKANDNDASRSQAARPVAVDTYFGGLCPRFSRPTRHGFFWAPPSCRGWICPSASPSRSWTVKWHLGRALMFRPKALGLFFIAGRSCVFGWISTSPTVKR